MEEEPDIIVISDPEEVTAPLTNHLLASALRRYEQEILQDCLEGD